MLTLPRGNQGRLDNGQINQHLDPHMLMDWLVRIVVSMVAIPSEQIKTRKQRRAMLQAMLLPALKP